MTPNNEETKKKIIDTSQRVQVGEREGEREGEIYN